MSFSTAQQGKYRPLVAAAWKAHCAGSGLNPKDKNAYSEWYRTMLLEELGVESSKDLCPRKHFAQACAVFEAVVGDSIYWQMRACNESARSVLFTLRKTLKQAGLSEGYARGIARQILGGELPVLENMEAEPLLAVLRAVKIYVRRNAKKEAAQEAQNGVEFEAANNPEPEDDGNPF